MAMLENELKIKCCSNPKLIWPVLFKRFIDDGFGITKGLWKDVKYWIEQFNGLRKTVQIDKYNWGNALDYVDLFIYKGSEFYEDGKFSVSIHQKDTKKFMYIPYRSFHQNNSSLLSNLFLCAYVILLNNLRSKYFLNPRLRRRRKNCVWFLPCYIVQNA